MHADAWGFGLDSRDDRTAQGKGSGTEKGDAHLQAQVEREAEARRALTAAALDAASTVMEFKTFLEERARPQSLQLKERAQAVRTMLEQVGSLEGTPDARPSSGEGDGPHATQDTLATIEPLEAARTHVT